MSYRICRHGTPPEVVEHLLRTVLDPAVEAHLVEEADDGGGGNQVLPGYFIAAKNDRAQLHQIGEDHRERRAGLKGFINIPDHGLQRRGVEHALERMFAEAPQPLLELRRL